MDGLEFAVLIGTALPSLGLAIYHDHKWKARNPKKLGFTWGYFVIYSTFANYLLVSGFVAWLGFDYGDTLLILLALVLLLSAGVIAYYAAQRTRWALVVATLASVNPLWIVINFFYLRNRWSELRDEGDLRQVEGIANNVKELSKEVRFAIFASASWAISVPVYILLFRPYGYMDEGEWLHMTLVILVPAVMCFILAGLFRVLFAR